MTTNRNNYLSTAKGIGIILMVMGHCGVPEPFGKFIYQFHMPLFFFCSGFFMKDILNLHNLYDYYIRRFKGIYIKFLFWSLLFLCLHNVFFRLNIYSGLITFRGEPSYLYGLSDFAKKAIKITFSMNEHEQLLRSFWFLKQLLIASIFVSTCNYIINKITHNRHASIYLLIAFIFMTLVSKKYNWALPAIWDISLVFMSSTFYLSGFIFRKFNLHEKFYNITYSTTMLVLLLLGLYILPWTNMLEYTLTTTIPFIIVAFSGTLLTINISRKLESYHIKYWFYYLGQNTMVIFALHMLCFKIGNLIKIGIYDMPIYHLAEFQIIYEHNTYFWIVYTIIGIVIPLFINLLMRRNQLTNRIWALFT